MIYLPISFLLVASYTDFKTQKIKNVLTYPMIFLGLILNTYLSGLTGFLQSFLGIVLALVLLTIIPGFTHRGGDKKLAMGVAAFVGMNKTLWFVFAWLLITLFVLNIKRIKEKGFVSFKQTVKGELLGINYSSNERPSTIGGPIMLIGYLIICFWQMQGGFV